MELHGLDDALKTLRDTEAGFKASRRPQLSKISEWIAEDIRKRIQGGVRPALSETTLRIRKEGGSTPLIASGDLLNSIKAFAGESQASAGTDLFYGRFQQFGITTGEKSAVPGKKVPARPFVLLGESVVDRAMDLLADTVFGDKVAA